MKRRIQLRKKIKLEELLLFLAMLCITSFALLEHSSVSLPIFSILKTPLITIGGVCLLTQIKLFLSNLRKKKYFFIFLTILLLSAGMVLVAVANRPPEIGVDPMRITTRFIAFLIEAFLLMIWIAETGRMKYILNFLFWYILILVLVTDFLLFSKIVVFQHGSHENYLVGTKFVVAYLHMDLLTLWYIRNNLSAHQEGKSKLFAFFATILILAVSIRVDCMTGVIGSVLLFTMFAILNTRLQAQFLRFRSPIVLLVFLTASVVFPFVAERIISIPVVERLVIELFGRDTTLTGRLGIFRLFGKQMTGHWLQGYGYGNGNLAAEWLFRCANAQNALLQWVLQVGVPVTLLLVVLMLLIFKQVSKSTNHRQIMPMIVLIYVYVILGLVETTFGMRFVLWLALIFMYTNGKELPKEEKKE